MNEVAWRSCTDPAEMLSHLLEQGTSDRKLRLLACACCRQIWDLLQNPKSRLAVEVSERFADDQATTLELARARATALTVGGNEAWAAYWAANVKPGGPLWNTFTAAATAIARRAVTKLQDPAMANLHGTWDSAQKTAQLRQVDLITEIIGNPFRVFVMKQQWLAWESGLLVRLAEGIYEDRAYDRMPILGDALEDAGCEEEEILRHCREEREHLRGCWVLDWVLSKP
jgi:hypothetical protein